MSVLFVGGVNRSGTTLLQSILCSDPKTNPLIQEASYLQSILDSVSFGMENFKLHGQYYFDSEDDLKQFSAEWLRRFLKKTRRRYPEAKHLALRYLPITPRFPLLQELMQAIGEQSKYLIMVRDPRDVIASMIRVGEKAQEMDDAGAALLTRDIDNLCDIYLHTYFPAFACKRADYQTSLCPIRYEDLVNNPKDTLDVIRQFSGLKLKNYKANADWVHNEIDMTHESPWTSDLWGKSISNARLNSYKEVLTPDEIAIIEKKCAGPLKDFGYKQ